MKHSLNKSSKTNAEKWEFLNSQDTKTLKKYQQSDLCENEIWALIYLILWKKMKYEPWFIWFCEKNNNNKKKQNKQTPGNDG